MCIREMSDDLVVLEFRCPKDEETESVHLFDITDLWEQCVQDLLAVTKHIEETGDTEPKAGNANAGAFATLCTEFLRGKKVKLAETALDGMLKAVMDGPDEDVIEGLRVYQALWSEMKSLESEESSRN